MFLGPSGGSGATAAAFKSLETTGGGGSKVLTRSMIAFPGEVRLHKIKIRFHSCRCRRRRRHAVVCGDER